MDSLPFHVIQYIQDVEPSTNLHLVYRDIESPSQRVLALERLKSDKLFSKNLRNIRGSYASVMFAYSSGDLEFLINTIPLHRFKNAKFHRLRLSGGFPYRVRMRFYKSLMLINNVKHYCLLKE